MEIIKQSPCSNSRKCYAVYVFVDGDLEFRFADFNFYRAKEFYDRMCVDNAFIFEMSVDFLPVRYRDYIAA